ncbi:MAG TPA: VWA domain-containing protein [Actinomycetota bacterium]|nr:VWA domain-containing protein [Actinomycetota bacterium]
MLARLLEFNAALREAGIPVAISEGLDALRALERVDVIRRDELHAALAATLVKDQLQRPAFDTLFDLHFSSEGRLPVARDEEPQMQTDHEMIEELVDALRSGNAGALRDVARRAVDRFGHLQSGGSREWFSNYEVLRKLEPNVLLQRLLAEVGATEPRDFDAQLARDELERRVRYFKDMVLADTRRRAAQQRGPRAVASYAVAPLPEDVNFLSATADIAELRRAVRPLARRLATRVALKRRRAQRGRLDVRRTVRRSLTTGGVPFDTSLKHRVPHRPDIVLLCDVSSSVARFARFALMLTHALSAQFARVRSFAFVDTIDEVTRFFEHEDFLTAVDRMNNEADVVSDDGHSDYGSVFERFAGTYGRDIGPKTTLLILGDARTNYRARRGEILRELASNAHRTYWLNPEPVYDWDTGDSAASEYAAVVDGMFEVRTLRQLEAFIERRL